MRLEELMIGQSLADLAFDGTAVVKAVEWLGPDRVNVTFKGQRGLDEVVLDRSHEKRLVPSAATTPFSFSGNAADFRIAAEARQISVAHLFDPYLALTSSTIEPLPHQITAVYGAMLGNV